MALKHQDQWYIERKLAVSYDLLVAMGAIGGGKEPPAFLHYLQYHDGMACEEADLPLLVNFLGDKYGSQAR